ncbi:hypothetical protein PC121_g19548 [Phytophthora cactorum]|nr:hypothetical protein PC121_g19548 [Phytophthora cactorum]
MMNVRVPDVTQLFPRELRVNLAEVGVETRIVSYFMKFNRLVEDNGRFGMLDRGPAVGEEGRQRIKRRCKLLFANVAPGILKGNSTTAVPSQNGDEAECKSEKQGDVDSETEGRTALTQATTTTLKCSRRLPKSTEPPTPDQKADAVKTLREKRDRQTERVKRITADDEPAFRTAVINGLLDVPFCPNTGSDANIIGLLAPTNIECLVLDTPVQELLLGTEALQWIGVNLDGIFEQLLQQNLEDAGAEADDVPSNQV